MTTALIIVDVQNDFIDGTLAVADAEQTAHRIATVLDRSAYDYVVTTQDWHINPGEHFSGTPDFIDTWPIHCKAGTWGAELSSELASVHVDAQFFKGQFAAAYSGFEATGTYGVILGKYLAMQGVTEVDIVGIATDYCVKATALDAVKAGFATRVLLPYCAAVNASDDGRYGLREAIDEMVEAGVSVPEVVS